MISLKNDKCYCKVIEWFPNYCQLERGCHISNKAPYSNPIQPELSCTCDVKTAHDKATKVIIVFSHDVTAAILVSQNNGGAAMLMWSALVNIRRKALGHLMIFTQGRTVQVLLLYRT